MPTVAERAYKTAKRILIALVGGTVVLIGVVMFLTPGPAMLVIPAGLAILAIEFEFARRWLRKVKETGSLLVRKVRGKSGPPV